MTEKNKKKIRRAEVRGEERDTSEGVHRKSATVSITKFTERERESDGER